MRAKEFTPQCTCGRKIKFSCVQLCEDRTILLVGYCHTCRQTIHCPITVANRKSVFLELIADREADSVKSDVQFLHEMGISVPEEGI